MENKKVSTQTNIFLDTDAALTCTCCVVVSLGELSVAAYRALISKL